MNDQMSISANILKATPSIGLEPASVFNIYNTKFMFHSPWSLTEHLPLSVRGISDIGYFENMQE